MLFIIHQTFWFAREWSKRVTWQNVPQLKLGNIRVVFNNFQNCACYEKYLKDNKHNSLNSARNHARIFTPGHDLFLRAHSFSRVSLAENCSLPGTDSVRIQISERIFAPNGDLLFLQHYQWNKGRKTPSKNKISLGKRCYWTLLISSVCVIELSHYTCFNTTEKETEIYIITLIKIPRPCDVLL